MYKLWKYPKLLSAGFKCSVCDSTTGLEVHHDEERMAAIIDKFTPAKHKLNWLEESIIVNKIIYYHYSNNTSGIVVCESCHDDIHREEG